LSYRATSRTRRQPGRRPRPNSLQTNTWARSSGWWRISRWLFRLPIGITSENNLGRTDLPSIQFTIGTALVDTDDGETSSVGRVVIGDETATTISEAMERNSEDPDIRTALADCTQWLTDYLTENSHADSRDVKKAGQGEGYSESTMKRARKALRVVVTNLSETPRRTVWSLPSGATRARGDSLTGLTDINTGQSVSGGETDPTSRSSRSSRDGYTREVTRLDDERTEETTR
jgi:hypothetical protein